MIQVTKSLILPVKRNVFYLEGKLLNFDHKYLINKIEEGIKEKNNLSFQTNVKGEMTDWRYFVDDTVFLDCFMQMVNYLESSPIGKEIIQEEWYLVDAWGLKNGCYNYTKEHTHTGGCFSGALYLNDSEQHLYFDEIQQSLKPSVGSFALFSSELNHYTKRSFERNCKYALAFNSRYGRI